MPRRREPWRDLQVGDRIRIVRVPGQNIPGYYLHKDTKRVYEILAAKRRIARVCQIDEWGLPWIACRLKSRRGKWEYHWLAVNDDSWEFIARSDN
jgi:hypothetical protein